MPDPDNLIREELRAFNAFLRSSRAQDLQSMPLFGRIVSADAYIIRTPSQQAERLFGKILRSDGYSFEHVIVTYQPSTQSKLERRKATFARLGTIEHRFLESAPQILQVDLDDLSHDALAHEYGHEYLRQELTMRGIQPDQAHVTIEEHLGRLAELSLGKAPQYAWVDIILEWDKHEEHAERIMARMQERVPGFQPYERIPKISELRQVAAYSLQKDFGILEAS